MALILDAELFAIQMAVEHIMQMYVCIKNYRGVVIYTDSQSVIRLLKNRSPHTNRNTVFRVQQSLYQVSKYLNFDLKLQWIPGHMNIQGNEMVDMIAKAAHNLDTTTWCQKSKQIKMTEVKEKLNKLWERAWRDSVDVHNKGQHLAIIRSSLGYWPWTEHLNRRLETAMARLRLGHVGLNKHLFRFNMVPSDQCVCGEVETVQHFLLECPLYEQLRAAMRIKLLMQKVECNLKNLLGGGIYDVDTQESIQKIVYLYLQGTGKLNQL